MEEKIKRILNLVKDECSEKTYVEAFLVANDGHYDEESGAYVVSHLEYRNGSPKDAGVDVDTLDEIVKSKCEELGQSFTYTKWDAMVYVARAFSVHWSTVERDLETAVTLAVEDMADTF